VYLDSFQEVIFRRHASSGALLADWVKVRDEFYRRSGIWCAPEAFKEEFETENCFYQACGGEDNFQAAFNARADIRRLADRILFIHQVIDVSNGVQPDLSQIEKLRQQCEELVDAFQVVLAYL
jgi:hypothetical protein